MASVLVDIKRNPTSKIRLLNPFPYSVDINQDLVLGQAEQIDSIKSTLKGQEHTAQEDNNFSVRQVTISNKSDQILNKVQEEISLENKEIPEHLKKLYHTPVKNCSEEENQVIAKLLARFQNSFSKNDIDIGLTNVIESPINTGNTQTVKQAQRRVSMAYAEAGRREI
ncbi:hypothetical protein DPMN_161378 [Dreissena polymorpha]|uniref:Uncharacterized protein n=1 Tax=Dreissena polymorpha TaxID=45954 RepID=A0A9D4IR19_DREPO|nr:hypothetical protein DPMN_161378 [Dreissena polymorpha]